MDERVTATKQGRLTQATQHIANQSLDGLIAASNGLNNFLDSNAVYVLSGVRPIGESAVRARPRRRLDPDRDAGLGRGARSRGVIDRPHHRQRRSRRARSRACVGTHRLDLSRTVSVGLSLLGGRWSIASRRRSVPCRKPPTNWRAISPACARPTSLRRPSARPGSPSAATSGSLNTRGPGIREFELAAELYCFMKKLGAEDNFLLMSASQHNLAVRAAGERVLDVGDIILSEITPCYRGQFAQICRTTVIGDAAAGDRRKIRDAAGRDGRGPDAGRAGASVADVTRAINGVLPKAGYGDYCRPPYMRVRGHGLGITSDRPGDIVDSNDARAGKRHGVRHASQPVHPGERLSDVRRAGRGHGHGARALSARTGRARRHRGLRRTPCRPCNLA